MKQKNLVFVGSTIFIAVILLVFLMLKLGEWKLSKGLTFYAIFNFANGILKDGPVMVSGVKLGKVRNIEFITIDNITKVRLEIWLEDRIAIKKDAKIYINQAGLMGEKYIEIDPGTAGVPNITPGEELIGIEPQKIDEIIAGTMDVIRGLNKAIDGFNDVFVEKDVKAKLRLAIDNLSTAIKNISELINTNKNHINKGLGNFELSLKNMSESTVSLKKMISANEENVNKIIRDISVFSETLNSIGVKNNAKINEMIDNLTKTIKTLENATANLQNDLTEMGKKLNSAATEIETAVKNKRKTFEASIDNFNIASKSLADLLSKNEKELAQSIKNFSNITTKLDKTIEVLNFNLEALRTEKGLLGVLIHNKQFSFDVQKLAENLQMTTLYLKHNPGVLLNKAKYVSPEEYYEFRKQLEAEERELKRKLAPQQQAPSRPQAPRPTAQPQTQKQQQPAASQQKK